MNQREALLAGAKQCLIEKGYGRTTARDITAASGAHLGSIGYHFGSKDRLMNAAALELTSEWGDTITAAARAAGGATPVERLTALINELLQRLPASRDLHSASLHAFAQAQVDDELRQQLAHGLTGARCALAAVVLGVPQIEPGSATERGLGVLVYSLVTGLIAQVLVDPDAVRDPTVVRNAIAQLVPTDLGQHQRAINGPTAGIG